MLPQFFGGNGQPDAVVAVAAWTADLFCGVRQQDALVADGAPGRLEVPVTTTFCADDPYLTPRPESPRACTGCSTGRGCTRSGAAHWPQWDQMVATAAAVLRT